MEKILREENAEMLTLKEMLHARGISDFCAYLYQYKTAELSELIHGGVGPQSMQNTARTWQAFAVWLEEYASAYENVVIRILGGHWLGKSGQQFAATMLRYVRGIRAIANRAEDIQDFTSRGVKIFEMVHTAVVPPEVINACRKKVEEAQTVRMLGLVTSDICEFQYEAMWAQNLHAMLSYRLAVAQLIADFSPRLIPTSSAPVADLPATAVHT